MNFKKKQQVQTIKGNRNVSSLRDSNIIENYINLASEDINDYGIIDDIIQHVIDQSKQYNKNKQLDGLKFIQICDKIELNFKDKDEVDEVTKYFKYAYTKISIISKKFSQLFTEHQKDLHSFMFNLYSDLKKAKKNNMEILKDIFENVIPSDKKKNPEYNNIAKAFTLFFFDDCTIFEKTQIEKILGEC